jgi:O-antigen/teichoic acid export membrane protein
MESAPASTPALDLEPPMLDASAGGPAGSVGDSTTSTSAAPLSSTVPTRKRGRSLWALADQVLISGTNFVTMVLVARGLDPAGFGAFNLVYGALLFANLFQSALVTQPHNVLGTRHGRRGPAYARYTTSTFLGQLVIVLVCATAALAGAGVAQVNGWQTAGLLMSLAPAIVGWQLQEFVRRVLYTEGRFSAALVNDVLSYGGQTIAIAVLWYLHNLTGAAAMYVLAITNAAGALLGVWQLRGSLSRHFDVADLWHNWHFGKWLAGGELLQWLSSIYLYQYLLAELLNAQATAQLKAAQLVFGPTRVLAFFLGTVLPIRFTHALAEGGERSMRSHYHRMLAVVAAMTGAYCLTVGVLATPLLRLFYKDKYAGSESVIILYATAAFLTYLSMVITAALTARRQTRGIFIGNVCGTVIGVALSLPMIRHWGVNGAVACMIASAVTMMLVSWFALRRGTAEAGFTPPHAHDPLSSAHDPLVAHVPHVYRCFAACCRRSTKPGRPTAGCTVTMSIRSTRRWTSIA